MTSGLVVDASVSAAWLLPDEATPYTESLLQATADREVWVPALWLLEMGNLLISAQRRKRIDAAKRRELVMAASALRLRVDREPVSMAAMDEVAASRGLSAYDAAYLELAIRRSLPMATQDAAMRKAMKASSVVLAEI
ncbi:MAG: type II toxin-antitoxin system VapC family toxin [Rubrivivax sp.]